MTFYTDHGNNENDEVMVPAPHKSPLLQHGGSGCRKR